ncbi:MAM domain-containing glycosylphosphatidylinositol anchor protein 2 [Camelus dromedarius]|uniref:MAM domain-containing glycosylphosphatidylinositol anchor protein 2 n=1 Tax=Camelus dromedarius TaxID=9838 RepID=A0A5N4E0N4_CAMDR|nr:MAM domain-containing glycosylphosphatidylinositol anchor protein 2 [Camelus dromedarius]
MLLSSGEKTQHHMTETKKGVGITIDLLLTLILYQLIFEGIRGPGIEGDIAIDDVSIAEGECAKQDLTTKSKCLFLDWFDVSLM